MKLYNISQFITKLNEVIKEVGQENILSIETNIDEFENSIRLKYKKGENINRFKYIFEKDEDEKDGYYKRCFIYKNGQFNHYNSLDEAIKNI